MSLPEHPRTLLVRGVLTKRPWLVPWVLLAVLFLIYALTARHGGGSWDTYTGNYASWHLVHSGHPWLDGTTVPGLEHDPQAWRWIRVAENGHAAVRRFPGAVAITLPAYWIAQADTMTVVPAAFTAAAASAIAITLLFLALRTRVPQLQALVACGVLALATPVWTIPADAVWAHTVTVLGIGGMAWAGATHRWWLVGVFGGVTLWGRLNAAIIVAVLGLLLGWARRSPRITVVIAAWSTVFLGLVCMWTHWWNGSWDPLASYGSDILKQSDMTGVRERFVSELALFFAPDRGVLVWTPVLALLLPALVRGWREVPDWAKGLALGGLAYGVCQAWIFDATGGDSFYGYRHGLELVAAAMPAVTMAAPRMGRVARVLIVPVVALQVCAFAFGSVTDMFLKQDVLWRDNTFIHDMASTWPFGPVILLPLLCLVLVVGNRLASALSADPAASEFLAPQADLVPTTP